MYIFQCIFFPGLICTVHLESSLEYIEMSSQFMAFIFGMALAVRIHGIISNQ